MVTFDINPVWRHLGTSSIGAMVTIELVPHDPSWGEQFSRLTGGQSRLWRVKTELASREWAYVDAYADAKGGLPLVSHPGSRSLELGRLEPVRI